MWQNLAEARIREWLSRPPEERLRTEFPLEPYKPLELQLMDAILELDRLVREKAAPEEIPLLRRQAENLMVRLLVLLEHEGRPLTAREFQERRAALWRAPATAETRSKDVP
jgi:hypothetical protein